MSALVAATSPSIAPAPAQDAAAVVRVTGLSMVLDGRPVLTDLNFTLAAHSMTALLGANGAGKSTLLRILATLIRPTKGHVELFPATTPVAATAQIAARRRLGMVSHQPMLYRDLSARENLEFYARLYDVADPARRATQLLELVGLSHRAADLVKTFSRGMTQRLSIARALVQEPELLLADEPFAGLDAASTANLEALFQRLHQEGRTLLFTHHDVPQSLRLARQVIVLQRTRIVRHSPTAGLDPAQVVREISAA